jgi:hypothetical protein
MYLEVFSIWGEVGGPGAVLGGPTYGLLTHASYIFFYLVSGMLNVPIWLAQRVVIITLLILTACGMYYLAYSLTHNPFASFLSSVLYTLNYAPVLNPVYSTAYILVPVLLGILINGINNGAMVYVIAFGLISVSLSFTFCNPPLFIVIVSILIAAIFYMILCFRVSGRRTAHFLVTAFSLSILLNLWWILPTLYILFFSQTEVVAKASLSESYWTFSRSNVLNIFRSLEDWTFSFQEYYSFDISIYNQPAMILITLLPIMLASLPLILKSSKKQPWVFFFGLLLIISIFLQKGPNPPLGEFYSFLFHHFPYFWIFREPKFKLPIALSISTLIGLLWDICLRRLKKVMKVSFLLSFSLSLILAFPLLTGQIIPPSYPTREPALIKIPDYWYDASRWINQQEGDFRILILPPDSFYQVRYDWGYYGVDNIPQGLIDHEVILPLDTEIKPFSGQYTLLEMQQKINSILISSLKAADNQKIHDLLSILNVRFIIYRNDLISSKESYKYIIKNVPGIVLVRNFTKLEIYEFNNSLQRIYIESGGYASYKKISTVKYVVQLSISSNNPARLIFLETHHPDWKLYQGDINWFESMFKMGIPSSLSHGFVNSWNITHSGTYTIYYTPQNFLNIGASASFSVLLFVLGYLIVSNLYPNFKRRA